MRRHGEGEGSKNLNSDEIAVLDDPLKIEIITEKLRENYKHM